MQLDGLDVRILRVLLETADLSHREVARRLGSSPTTVGERLKAMRKAGVVEGATLRLGRDAWPGHQRLVRGRLGPGEQEAVLDRVAGLPGVVEAVATSDGAFFATLVVRDLDGEEKLLSALGEAGVLDIAVSMAQRVAGPPPVHLFTDEVALMEACAVCARQVAEPLVEQVDGRRVVFCCPSCRKLYWERYADLAHKSGRGLPEGYPAE